MSGALISRSKACAGLAEKIQCHRCCLSFRCKESPAHLISIAFSWAGWLAGWGSLHRRIFIFTLSFPESFPPVLLVRPPSRIHGKSKAKLGGYKRPGSNIEKVTAPWCFVVVFSLETSSAETKQGQPLKFTQGDLKVLLARTASTSPTSC